MRKLIFLLPLFIANIAIAQIPTTDLVGYWPFNGNANDESANNNDGTVNGAVLTTDNSDNANKAYQFNGVDQYIVTNTSIDDNLGNGATFSVWIYFTGSTSGRILMNYNGQGTPGDCNGRVGFALTATYENRISIFYALDGDNLCGRKTAINSITPNTWYHVVATWDGTMACSGFKIYLNGIQSDVENSVSGSMPSCGYMQSDNPFHFGIGVCSAGICNGFEGKLDNIRIYKRDLNESEITALSQEFDLPEPQNAWQTNGDDIFYYNGEGNVGIGTNTPAAKLTVDGPVLATEVKVKTDISTYPDFVFKPEYKLRSIEETELYIKENGHLPEIPKVSEIEGGINLGEMNVKLLQKVEELTLYIIEQNKKIEHQNNKILELEEKLNTKK